MWATYVHSMPSISWSRFSMYAFTVTSQSMLNLHHIACCQCCSTYLYIILMYIITGDHKCSLRRILYVGTFCKDHSKDSNTVVLISISRAICVYSEHDDAIKWPFVRGIHLSPVNSPHKGQWYRDFMLSLIYAWTNVWAYHRNAGDLRRHCAQYDVTWWYANTPFTDILVPAHHYFWRHLSPRHDSFKFSLTLGLRDIWWASTRRH